MSTPSASLNDGEEMKTSHSQSLWFWNSTLFLLHLLNLQLSEMHLFTKGQIHPAAALLCLMEQTAAQLRLRSAA